MTTIFKARLLHGRIAGPRLFPYLHVNLLEIRYYPRTTSLACGDSSQIFPSFQGTVSMMTYQDSPIQCGIVITIDKFIDSIMVRGQGAFMAQFDVATVRCNIADHPEDWYLLGVYYVYMALPSGLCSAPFISPLLHIWWNGP